MSSNIDLQLQDLLKNYHELITCYENIAQHGESEERLIEQGDMEKLLALLNQKEQVMVAVARYQAEINRIQANLAEHFKLDSFSLTALKTLAPGEKRQEIGELERVIDKLLKELEALESQEQRHESMLKKYADSIKRPTTSDVPRNETVKKAYRNVLDSKKNDIDFKS